MNRHTIPLGRILGIPIRLDYSWFLIFALLTGSMAVGYYPAEFKNWPVAQYGLMGAVTAIMLFVSVLLHELGHSKVRPDTGLWEAPEEMDRDGVNQLPVMSDGQIQGVLSREDVVSYLRTLRGLGL